jgi:hypothetical protein
MYRGRWVWAPYGYYRSNRSYWYPALVVVQVYNNNICWYPIGYRGRYRDYNGWHRGGRRDRDRDRPRDGVIVPPVPARTPKPMGKYVPVEDDNERGPVTGVIVLPKEDFGTGKKIGKTADEPTTKGILAKRTTEESPELPRYETVKPRIGKDIIASTPPISKGLPARSTGAAPRDEKTPLDTRLRQTRIFGDRRPATTQTQQTPTTGVPDQTQIPRIENGRLPKNTGAVERQPRPSVGFETKTPEVNPPSERAVRPRIEPVRREQEKQPEQPRQETPRSERPIQKETPRYEPPPRRETPPPRNDPPPRRDPPAPKSESKPSPPPSKQEPSKQPAPSIKGKG